MPRVTAPSLRKRKQQGDKIAMLTAYDFPSAQLADEAGIDVLLVGDSCAMAVMGRRDTLSMTMDEMVHHTKMVTAAAQHALVVADMPFLSYQISREEAIRNAGRLIVEGGASAVKLEGRPEIIGEAVEGILNSGIPVMGHLGLMPQCILKLGGYKIQGRDEAGRHRILEAARQLEALGCFSVVLECVPPELAVAVTDAVSIPTIGIGAGKGCDGQVLVMHDMLGWGQTRFTKTYADVRGIMKQAFEDYVKDVKATAFPAAEHTYT